MRLNNKNKNSIRIFYHCANMNDRIYDIVNEQLKLLNTLPLSSDININISSSSKLNNRLKKHIRKKLLHKKVFISESNVLDYEYPTLIRLYKNIKPSDYVLYFHTKGISYTDKEKVINSDKWRHRMEDFCFGMWEECIKKLNKGYDVCCESWITLEELNKRKKISTIPAHKFMNLPYVDGNFWWSRGRYIKSCDINMLYKWKYDRCNRFWAETFLGSGVDPKVFSLR